MGAPQQPADESQQKVHIEGVVAVSEQDRLSGTTRAYIGIIASVLVLSILGFFGAIAIATDRSNAASTRSLQAFCSLVGTLDASYRQQPPQTLTGQLVAARIHTLYVQPPPYGLGCPITGTTIPLPTASPLPTPS